jgi:hypothetical protein
MLAGLTRRQVERGLSGVHAELFGPRDGPQYLGRLQELFGWYAPAMQAGPADAFLFDQPDPKTSGGAIERCGIPSWAATENDHIELVRHQCSFRRRSFFTIDPNEPNR